jgi:ATP-dependent metalloprotease
MYSIKSQLHAGQLRYHDFSKLREAYNARQSNQQPSSQWKIHSNLDFGFPQRRYFLSSVRDHATLKRLEKEANQAPTEPAMQYDFVEQLAQKYPQSAVERYAMKDFVVDDRLAVSYLQAMQRSNQYSHFRLQDFMDRVELMPLQQEALKELAPSIHGMSKAKQVAAVLNVLQNPLSGGAAGIGMAGALSSQIPQQMRGTDPKKPLFVQIQQSSNMGSTAAGILGRILISLILVSALVAVMDEKGVGRAMGMNGSKHVQEAEGTNVRFKDVKGVDEAKAELEEIVMYLKDPSRFTRLGGKLPRGLLLTGPPGTGKTLLAKAIAGEAGVPFFFSSGSQFEEVYVGLGAKRIRELFESAKKKAPAIIFIDEIDAVGGTRRLKDQSALKMTLNELLVQLDGFDENDGIIVIGATNFMESLDKALLRPGRFDKHVTVPLPDVGGRKEILEMYAEKTKLAKDVDLNVLARGTTGFSGADLYNLMNQAALKASVDGLNSITMSVLEYAKDKIMMGAERRTAVITAETARCTAYHEAGHALVATLTPGAQPIHKATIMPRGASLGMVTMLPEGDQTSQSLKEMRAFMDVAMGGRVAEELIFGPENVTSGAMSDIAGATKTARNMVTKYGFSERVGLVFHPGETGEESASDETRAQIDEEVKRMTEGAYERAKDLLKRHSKEHHLLAETLLEYETLTGEEVRALIMNGTKPKRPVINKEGGQRGDTSVIGAKGRSPVSIMTNER